MALAQALRAEQQTRPFDSLPAELQGTRPYTMSYDLLVLMLFLAAGSPRTISRENGDSPRRAHPRCLLYP